jgi:3-(3-hydroxy-phenyl)propionate hydroxylase
MTAPAMEESTDHCDVAIVGFGPTGVSAANFLGAQGVRCIAFERDRDIYPRARAVTVNDWTLRCYQSVGLVDELLKVMEPMTELRWRTYSGRELMRSRLPASEMGLPVSCMIYQPAMEQVLRSGAERFREHVDVRYGQAVTAVHPARDHTIVVAQDVASGETRTVRARYVLACDGGSSRIRHQLGIAMDGATVDTTWVVIDVRVKRWWPERHLLTFWSDSRRPVVDIPLALGNHRWEFPLRAEESEADFATHEQLWTLLASMGVSRENVEIHQHAFYKHHVRQAQQWRKGPVFLLGDAAHLMPPWAGSGMQSGIRDAFNLSWKLARVLDGVLPESVLDSYHAERAPDVTRVTEVSEQLGRIIKRQMTASEKLDGLRRLACRALHLPEPPAPLSGRPSLDAGWLVGPPRKGRAVGQMLPQPRVSTASGRHARLDDLLGAGFVLLGDGVDPAQLLTPKQKQAWSRLESRFITVRDGAQAAGSDDDVIDLDGSLLTWMRNCRTRCVAVRPDRFVAACEGLSLDVPTPFSH